MDFWIAGDADVLVTIQPHQFNLPLADMHVQVEGTSPDVNSAYGLVCRYTDQDNYYTIHVSSDGNFWLYKRVGGNWTNLGSGPNSAVQVNNSVELWCVGNEISAAVNGTTVIDVHDDSLTEGNAGLFAQPLGGALAGGQSYTVTFQYFEMTVYP